MNKIIAEDTKITNKLLKDFDKISSISITFQIANTLMTVVAKTNNANKIEKNLFITIEVIFIIFFIKVNITNFVILNYALTLSMKLINVSTD